MAPPEARLYDSSTSLLYSVAAKATQPKPPLAVQPGRGGLPRGFSAVGLVPEKLKPLCE